MNNEDKQDGQQARILSRFLARALTPEEMELVSGGDCVGSSSSCSGSDNSSCDLDHCDVA